jgi:hypothetical protein
MPPVLVCNIAWMKRYQGIHRDDEPVGGGAYVREKRLADECYGGLVNKDQFLVVRNSLRPDLRWPFVSVGPLKPDKNHWLPDLPPEVYSAKLLEG